MNYRWNLEKNKLLKEERNICFEDVLTQIYEDNILDIIKHPNQEKYQNQSIYIVELQNYTYMIPLVKEDSEIFLKTF